MLTPRDQFQLYDVVGPVSAAVDAISTKVVIAENPDRVGLFFYSDPGNVTFVYPSIMSGIPLMATLQLGYQVPAELSLFYHDFGKMIQLGWSGHTTGPGIDIFVVELVYRGEDRRYQGDKAQIPQPSQPDGWQRRFRPAWPEPITGRPDRQQP